MYLFGGPNNKDPSILESLLGSPYFGKLPFRVLGHCAWVLCLVPAWGESLQMTRRILLGPVLAPMTDRGIVKVSHWPPAIVTGSGISGFSPDLMSTNMPWTSSSIPSGKDPSRNG